MQSPLLKKVLGDILQGYPGVTVDLQRLEFSGHFKPLIHRFPDLNAEVDRLRELVEEEKRNEESANETSSSKIEESNGQDVDVKEILEQTEPKLVQVESYDSEESAAEPSKSDGLSNMNQLTVDAATQTVEGSILNMQSSKGTNAVISEQAMSEMELTLKHAELLGDLLMAEFRDIIESSQDMIAQVCLLSRSLRTVFIIDKTRAL